MGIYDKIGNLLFNNTFGKLIINEVNKGSKLLQELLENKKKNDLINNIYEYGLNKYGNEPFYDIFYKDFFNIKYLTIVYDSLNTTNNKELNSVDKLINHFYKESHYPIGYQNDVKCAIADIINCFFVEINKPLNHTEQTNQSFIQNNNDQIVTPIIEKIDELKKTLEEYSNIPNINIDDFTISSNKNDDEIKPIPVEKKPKSINVFFYNKFYNVSSDYNSLLAFLEFSGQEQSFDIVKHIILYDDNTTTEEIINSEINDNVLSFQMPYCDEILKSKKIFIKPPRTEYSISIETSNHEIIVPNYNVYFTRERNGDIITTTWNDISVESNVIINFIVSFSSITKETIKFKFNINAKNPKDVYSQYHYYKVLDMLKKSDKIIFRDNSTHNILLETATLNVNISDDDLDYFIKLYNNALWVQDKYNIGFTVPEEVCYEDYVTLEMLRNIKENRYYIFPNNFQINCIVPYDENYEKQNEIDNEQLYTAGYESKYIDIWGTHINFTPDEPLRMILSCANIEKTTDGIKITSIGTIYATTVDKSGDQLLKIDDII